MMFALGQRERLTAFHTLTSVAIAQPAAFARPIRLDL